MFEILARPLCRICRGGGLGVVVENLEDFAGDFPGGFFWALFRTNMRRTNPAKQSGGSKINIREKNPFCQETDPKKSRQTDFKYVPVSL